MINIAFLVSANKTIIFEEVSKRLKMDGYNTYWISPSQNWTKWLISNNILAECILNLPEKVINISSAVLSKDELKKISHIEVTNKISFRDIYLMDRVLREKNSNYSLRYMLRCFNEVSNFLIDNRVICLFSEQTWNFEIISTLACNSIGINSYYVDGVKVPDGGDLGRFTFYLGYNQGSLALNEKPITSNFEFAKKFLIDYRKKRQGTVYLKTHFNPPALKMDWPKKFVKHLVYLFNDKHDLTRRPIISLIEYRLKQLFTFLIVKVSNTFETSKLIPSKYVLIALHKPDDSALDVQSSSYINQIEAIKAFIRKVPIEYKVIIKDHPHALGLNSLSNYRVLRNIPSVIMINPKVDIFTLIDQAELIFTLSGTVSLESALMGKRALTANKKYFSEVMMRESISPYELSSSELRNILAEDLVKDSQLVNYLAKIHANSYKGMVMDPTLSDIYSSKVNRDNVYAGFKKFLSHKVSN
jgi:hypothetical protein